jgi:hypothetical protein
MTNKLSVFSVLKLYYMYQPIRQLGRKKIISDYSIVVQGGGGGKEIKTFGGGEGLGGQGGRSVPPFQKPFL